MTHELPSPVFALIFHAPNGDLVAQGSEMHQEALHSALAIARLTNEPVRVVTGPGGALTLRVELTKDGPIAFAVDSGHAFMKSAKRWAERFARQISGRKVVKVQGLGASLDLQDEA